MAMMHRTNVPMELELNVAVAATAMIVAFIIDWPRALLGLALGIICRFLPYGTIVVPLATVIVSALTELLYAWFDHVSEPHFWNFFIGIFAVAGTAASVYITTRNLKDRL